MRKVGNRCFVYQSGAAQSFITACQRRKRSNQIRISNAAVRSRAFGKCVTQAKNQVLLLIKKLIADFNFGKQRCLIELFNGTRLLMLARLLQINAFARTVQRNLALLAAALRTDPTMYGWTEALLFALFANSTAQTGSLSECSVFRHAGVNTICPGENPAGKVVDLLEARLPQEVRRFC